MSVGGTRMQFTQTLDVGNKYTSGGTALSIGNTNMGSSNNSGATITAGAVVVAAATSKRRLLGNQVIGGANIDVVWDQFEFVFGSTGGLQGGLLTPTTVAKWFTVLQPAIAIAPGTSWAVHQWQAAQSTGPTFEVLFDYIER